MFERTESGKCPYYSPTNPNCVCMLATPQFASRFAFDLKFLYNNINERSRMSDYCIGGKYGNRFSACTYFIMWKNIA